jgi:SAM-dependent methyltransferase
VTPAGGRREPYYGTDLALIHDAGFSAHADACAPGLLRILEPVLRRSGLVVELGCGSGALTRHLIDAGHRVVATDASPAMLALARGRVPDADEIRPLTLPHDPIPAADAIVSVGHAVSYVEDAPTVERTIVAMGSALRPGGTLAFDVCDLSWATNLAASSVATVEDEWAVMVRYTSPREDRLERAITSFVAEPDGRWRRDDEIHVMTLVDTERIPGILADVGVQAEVRPAFGDDSPPPWLHAVVGRRT